MELEKCKHLLSEVNKLTSKYYEQAKATGEWFNIFQILGMESKENKTHSAFLYALLNPKGEHLQGSVFLELFLKKINCTDVIDSSTAFVTIERYIGIIDINYETGGRIDLVIEDKQGNAILIENKIYALDQLNQLQRYYNFGIKYHKSDNRKFKVIYLTLNGDNPQDCTTGKLEKEVVAEIICLSYKEHVIEWLNECIKKVAKVPILREAIIQYQNLLKSLTNNSNKKNMENDIKSLITSSEDNFKAAIEIETSVCSIKDEILNNFRKEINIRNNELMPIKYLHYNIVFRVSEDSPDGFWFSFSIYDSTNNKHVQASLQEFNQISAFLNKLNPKFINNGWNLGWVNPSKIRKFDDLSVYQIFELNYNEKRKRFINEIFEEGLRYYEELEKHIQEIQTTI